MGALVQVVPAHAAGELNLHQPSKGLRNGRRCAAHGEGTHVVADGKATSLTEPLKAIIVFNTVGLEPAVADAESREAGERHRRLRMQIPSLNHFNVGCKLPKEMKQNGCVRMKPEHFNQPRGLRSLDRPRHGSGFQDQGRGKFSPR